MSPTARTIAEHSVRAKGPLASASTDEKNAALRHMAELIAKHREEIVSANAADRKSAAERGIAGALLERLVFDESKVDSRIESLNLIADLPDPVGQIGEMSRRPNGLLAGRMRVPLGVILMVYEARPHVTVNGGAFALKSGNAVILRGGSEARQCNAVLGRLWREALQIAGLPAEAVQVVDCSHDVVAALLQLDDMIDLVIPRGGEGLIRTISEQSKIPVIKHFKGVCHVYIGRQADTSKALRIALDSKLLMPAVCNAAETLLVDESMAAWLPLLVAALQDNGVEVRGCAQVCQAVPQAEPATEEDWAAEYLDRIYSVRVVSGVEQAIAHIAAYGSGHTDSIVTENYSDAQRFMQRVDSAVVLVNASTMFCDGQTLGMGAEIGISTDKLHARGPMGLEELTSYKHVIWGDGHAMGEAYQGAGKVES